MFESNLRNALTDAKMGKDMTRSAGEGVWAYYVRATCYPSQPDNVEQLDSKHKALVEELNSIKELSKDEKNSLRSAKSVIGKAVSNGVDVWQREDSGAIKSDDKMLPMPKGKSELQEAKTDFERMMAYIDGATKKWESDTREVFNEEQLNQIWAGLAVLADSVLAARNEQ
jgi:hypothetical protein